MTKLGKLASAFIFALLIGGYTGGVIADTGGVSKFADPQRLYDALLSDDQAVVDAALAELNALHGLTDPADMYTAENIGSVLEGLQTELTTVSGSLPGLQADITTADGTLLTTLGVITGATVPAGPTPEETLAAAQATLADPLLTLTAQQVTDLTAQITTLEGAITAEQTAQQQVADLTVLIGEIEPVVATVEPFNEKVALFDALSDEEILALNRSLNNALNNGLLELLQEYDAEILAMAVGKNKQQINFLTKAYEEYVKLLDKGMVDKAEAQQAKFLAKMDAMGSLPKGQLNAAAKAAAKDVVKGSVKSAAKGAAKGAAKSAAKGAAKSAAKGAAKSAAKGAAKSAAKDAAKNAAKGAAKNAAKQAAKAAAKNAAKQAAKNAAKQNAKGLAKGKS